MSNKAEKLQRIRQDIREACVLAGRDPDRVKLIAVSKAKSWEDVRDFLSLGLTDFGENYAQEALPKMESLASWQALHGGPAPSWHFIGHLQSNKAKLIPGKFGLIHSLDSSSLASKLNRAAAQAGLTQECLVEVNLDQEGSKAGIIPEELPGFLEELGGLSSLKIRGLMGIPAPSPARPPREPFARLRKLLEHANSLGLYPSPLTELSMGMSGDFRDAILEGATMVRVGTALFGERK